MTYLQTLLAPLHPERSSKFSQNRWFRLDELHLVVYIRVTRRRLMGVMCNTLELANVSVDEPFRRRGHFNALLCQMESIAQTTNRTLYIENVTPAFLKKKFMQHDAYIMLPLDFFNADDDKLAICENTCIPLSFFLSKM